MGKRTIIRFKYLFYILPFIFFCFSSCAVKTTVKTDATHDLPLSVFEIKKILKQLDSFDPKDREKGARKISSFSILEDINSLSETLDLTDIIGSKNYLNITEKTVKEIRPVVPALFNNALDINPNVKKSAINSLQNISSCLLKMILTTYSIKNACSGDEKKTEVFNDAEKVLNEAKTLNEDIITFFRNETADRNQKFLKYSMKKTAAVFSSGRLRPDVNHTTDT